MKILLLSGFLGVLAVVAGRANGVVTANVGGLTDVAFPPDESLGFGPLSPVDNTNRELSNRRNNKCGFRLNVEYSSICRGIPNAFRDESLQCKTIEYNKVMGPVYGTLPSGQRIEAEYVLVYNVCPKSGDERVWSTITPKGYDLKWSKRADCPSKRRRRGRGLEETFPVKDSADNTTFVELADITYYDKNNKVVSAVVTLNSVEKPSTTGSKNLRG